MPADIPGPLEKAPWPYGAQKAREELDVRLIESHAADILARALPTGRLLVFAGAGLTMAYGRMTWGQLLEVMYLDWFENLAAPGGEASAPEHGHYRSRRIEVRQRLRDKLWPERISDFRQSKGDYTIVAQMANDLTIEADDEDAQALNSFKASTAAALADYTGRLHQLIGDKSVRLADFKRQVTPIIERQPDISRSGRRALLGTFIRTYIGQIGSGSPQIHEPLVRAYRATFEPIRSAPGGELESPLDLLINALGVRRFATTNYDREIERALEAFDFPARPGAPAAQRQRGHGPWHEAAELTESTTARAICFAVEGARRHASVLHLHGVCDDPERMIITESDYQHLYLEEHAARDLLQDAARATFAANAVLFVGSSVEEDDIMRPLRQFLTGVPHLRDRMAVALLPATRSGPRLARQSLDLYLRFGIHVVHYGRFPDQAGGWTYPLRDLDDLCGRLESFCAQITESREAAAGDTPAQLPAADWGKLSEWGPAGTGDVPDEERAQHVQLVGCLQAVAGRLQDCAGRLADGQVADEVGRLRLAVQELRSAFTTRFMCEALRRLFEDARERQARSRNVAPPYLRPDGEVDEFLKPPGRRFTRHAIATHRDGYDGWFASLPAHGRPESKEPVRPLESVIAQILREKRFREFAGRRVLVIGAPRGAGKGGLFDSLRYDRPLRMLLDALQPPRPEPREPPSARWWRRDTTAGRPEPLVFHINLSFSTEIGAILTQLANTILKVFLREHEIHWSEEHWQAFGDQLERMALAMEALQLPGWQRRCVLLLGNAGILFDEDGVPKNGQIRRFVQLLRSPTFTRARLDIVLFCNEMDVPAELRAPRMDATVVRPEHSVHDPNVPALATLTDHDKKWEDGEFVSWLRQIRRRQQRYNLWRGADHVARPGPPSRLELNRLLRQRERSLLLTGFRRVKASELWDIFQNAGPDAGTFPLADEQLQDIFGITGGHRMAMTLIFAYLRLGSRPEGAAAELRQIANELRGSTPDSVVEKVTELILARWFRRHLNEQEVRWPGPDRDTRPLITLNLHRWNLASEAIWTLSMLSQPVETRVLLDCTPIRNAARACLPEADPSPQALEDLVGETLELLVHWCLVFRIDHRPEARDSSDRESRYRYALHRLVQRHFVQLSGGGSVEVPRWDQFATTLYASQPDELPILTSAAHHRLVELVKDLSGYPRAFQEPLAVAPERVSEGLRAAYALVRSSFSMGVLARSGRVQAPREACGSMEEYRRLVRWIALRAQEHPGPVFYPGELVWIYNECGVIALAQGKLDQAEAYTTMAQRAARYMEHDDSGPLHVRIRLHTALTLIERGHPAQGKAILVPISMRHGGHPVPVSLARFYLGLIEHLGGNYQAAQALYEEATQGLRRSGRSRALAFVLQAQADLHLALHRHQVQEAVSMAEEAESLAQRGGHEDVRVLATLTRARLRIESGEVQGLFDQLDYAQRYANHLDMPRIACEAHELRARLLLRQGETVMSAKGACASLEIAALYDLKLMKARAMLTLAGIYFQRADRVNARVLVETGKEVAVAADYFSCVRGFTELQARLAQGE